MLREPGQGKGEKEKAPPELAENSVGRTRVAKSRTSTHAGRWIGQHELIGQRTNTEQQNEQGKQHGREENTSH